MSGNVTPTLPDKSPIGYVKTARLHDLLEATAKRLRTDCPLIADADILCLPEYEGDLWNNIKKILNKQLGILLVIGLESVNSRAEGSTAFFRDIALVVRCYESVLLNQSSTGTRIPALALAEAACYYLHDWIPTEADVDAPQPLAMQENNTLHLDPHLSKPENGMICWVARFTTSGCVSCLCE
jgi:hypothetical protein